ncbi:MAG: phenylacetate--CoA ligase family protein [Deltaproteobacteria bacterium]|nr:phenylacetate--CoA ligase family protein [Deltaproteobacteria bacterium]MCL4874163.1 hypothetical protein [bacterium]
MSTGKSIYDKAPVFLQNLLLTGYSALLDRKRYGRQFSEYAALLERSQWLSGPELASYQEERLRLLIGRAYDTVPYYRRVFDERGLKPGDIRTPADLPKLPVLTRQDIKDNFKDLLSTGLNVKTVPKGHTSGTTGSPLEVCYDRSVIQFTYAALDRHYRWAGCELSRAGDRIAVARGNVIVPLGQESPPFWRYNRVHNQILLSSFHLSRKNLGHYFRELERYRPAVFDGYPSTLYVLAKYLHDNGRTFPAKAVITSSETLYDFQRELIEKSFGCRVFDYYALAERTVFASECSAHCGNHLYPEYGITEVLDRNGEACAPGEAGLLVTTGLHNLAMPLIRYATSDMTSIRPAGCACGRRLPVIEPVTTKAEDMLTLEDGRVISPSVLTHPFKPLDSVAASQIVQEGLNDILVRIVPNSNFTPEERDHLVKELKARLGERVNVNIELVNEVPRSRSGKFRWVISNVKLGI